MTSSIEKTLYRYSCALENADFDTISAIMMQAAHDPTLKAHLFELEAAYQTELYAAEAIFPPAQVPAPFIDHQEATMQITSTHSNGHGPVLLDFTRSFSFSFVFRAALLLVALLGIILAAQPGAPGNPVTTTFIAPDSAAQTSLLPQNEYPVITPENVKQLVQVQRLNTGTITHAYWSPDGSTIVVVGYGIRLLDAETLEEINALDTGTYIISAAYSPDGTRLATGCFDGTLRVYDVAAGSELLHIQAFEEKLSSIAYSPDGTLIATASEGDDTRVRVWEVETGREYLTLFGLSDRVSLLTFSPDGSRLAGAGLATFFRLNNLLEEYRPAIMLWDTVTGRQLMRLGGPDQIIRSIDFSPDSTTLIASSGDGNSYEWSVTADGETERAPTNVLTDDTDFPVALGGADASPDRHLYVAVQSDGNLQLWIDGQFRKHVNLSRDNIFHIDNFTDVVFSPDGQRLLINGYYQTGMQVWSIDEELDVEMVAELPPYLGYISALAISRDNILIAAGGDNGFRIWDTETGSQIAQNEQVNTGVLSVDFSPVDNQLAIGGHDLVNQTPLQIWGQAPRSITLTRNKLRPFYYSATFDATGTRLFATSDDPDIQIWDATTGDVLVEYEESDTAIFGIIPHPSGDFAVFWDDTRLLHRWDPDQQVELEPLMGHSARIRTAAFTPDGRLLVSLDANGTLIVWNVATWEEIAYISSTTLDYHAMALSPDGRLVALGSDQSITLIDLESQQHIRTLEGLPASTQALAFSDDGTLLLSAGYDGLVRVWAIAD